MLENEASFSAATVKCSVAQWKAQEHSKLGYSRLYKKHTTVSGFIKSMTLAPVLGTDNMLVTKGQAPLLRA